MKYAEAKLGEGIYTVKDLSLILGISPSKARYWVNAYVRDSLLKISDFRYNLSPDKGIFVNFNMLIQIYVFEQLKKRGFNKPQIIEAYNAISKKYDTKYPFALKNLYTSGKSILFLDELGIVSADKKFQLNLDLLKPFMDKIGFNDLGVANRFYPIGSKKSVVVNPSIQFGSPTIEGTRLNAKVIFDLHQAGEDHTIISRIYSVSKIQISDAIELFAHAA